MVTPSTIDLLEAVYHAALDRLIAERIHQQLENRHVFTDPGWLIDDTHRQIQALDALAAQLQTRA